MNASPGAQVALREAMERLLSGKSARTDGALTKNNLFKEAGVSRATMNRAREVLDEWDRRVAGQSSTLEQDRLRRQLAQARADLARSRRANRSLQDSLDAAATVIALLAAENAALRDRAGGGVVKPLPRRTSQRRPV